MHNAPTHQLSARARARLFSAMAVMLLVVGLPLSALSGATDVNMLSSAQQTFESTPMKWVAQGNTTISRSTSTANAGSASLRVKVDASGPWPDSTRTARTGTLTGNDGVPVSPGETYKGSVWVKPGSRVSPVRCELRWYQSDGLIIDTVPGAMTVESAGAWQERTCQATAPVGTTHAGLRVFINKANYGDIHYVDEAWLVQVGTSTTSTSAAPPASTTTTLAPATTTTTAAPVTTTTTAPPTTTTTTTAPPPSGGTTYPDRGSVGFLGNAASLQVIDGSSTPPSGTSWNSQYNYLEVTADNFVLDGVYIKGGIDFYGRGTLIVRNSIVEGGYGTWFLILGRTGGSTMDVRDSTLRWRQGSTPDIGAGAGAIQIQASVKIVAIRNDISGTPDGIQAAGADSRIESNWIHNLALLGTYPDNTHNDGIQIYDGDRFVIANNRIEIGFDGMHQNAAVFFQPGDGNTIASPQVTGNYLQGGGFTLRLEKLSTSSAVINDNVFGPLEGGAWGYAYCLDGATIAQWTNNRTTTGETVSRP